MWAKRVRSNSSLISGSRRLELIELGETIAGISRRWIKKCSLDGLKVKRRLIRHEDGYATVN